MTNPWAPPERDLSTGPLAGFGQGPPVASQRPGLLADVLVGLAVAAGVLLLAGPVGLLWAALAPHADVVVQAQGAGFAEPEAEDFIGSDASFVLLTCLVGGAIGYACWRTLRRWGPGVVVALAVGSLAASFVAAEVGTRVGREEFRAAVTSGVPAEVEANVRLLAREATVGWPLAALLGFLVPLAYTRTHTD